MKKYEQPRRAGRNCGQQGNVMAEHVGTNGGNLIGFGPAAVVLTQVNSIGTPAELMVIMDKSVFQISQVRQ